MHYTTSRNTQSSAPEDGRDQRPKRVELIGIINKPLLLHLVVVYIKCALVCCNKKSSQKVLHSLYEVGSDEQCVHWGIHMSEIRSAYTILV